jgi:rRNA maturation endonuclease Nob1
MRLISELESGDDYRGLIEKELKLRLELPVADAPARAEAPSPATRPTCRICQKVNDADAKFCKSCGEKL